eukprot:gnl/MRDRNA2_/MRDRNA2_102742_c0_seq1.p1 gnl/MRDRNA2_/MRDRNA2_102742_c0~~gnl/MRDRNA2_/MRDRNA2_102742_c0_seq1.p1  ORF type:complete len:650 (+),score=129.91 gnl/MRDRNA2_/MRDRNA2_102742_c0_seq1:75-2024(+)
MDSTCHCCSVTYLLLLMFAPVSCMGSPLCLLQASQSMARFNFVVQDGVTTCAPLANKGSHFTVDIEVGTPGQKFSVVADTGSDSVIVPSCLCQEEGSCDQEDRCFRGTNKSSTFVLQGLNSTQLGKKQPKKLPVVQMVFGSGAVQAVVATDVVKVGTLKAKMQDGLLLMVNHQLRMVGNFEGILGLGQPKNETQIKELQKQMEEDMAKSIGKSNPIVQQSAPLGSRPLGSQAHIEGKVNSSGSDSGMDSKAAMEIIKKMMRDVMGGAAAAGGGPNANAAVSQPIPDFQTISLQPAGALQESLDSDDDTNEEASDDDAAKKASDSGVDPSKEASDGTSEEDPIKKAAEAVKYKTKSFLQTAKINSFSMCFNDKGEEGALRLGTSKAEDALTSTGIVHWGLNMEGMTIGSGDEPVPVKICSKESMKEGQKSACGAIPDSGTTLFMGPQEHIEKVFEGICDGWKRCHDAASTGLQDKKAEIVAMLLSECGEWLTEEHGLDELPALHFKLAGENGKKKTLSFDGAAYIIETMEDDVTTVWKSIMGLPMKVPQKTGTKSKVCRPAFGVMDMNTATHGPIWILGSPTFYEYTVGYDLDESKPAISFVSSKSQPCGCSKDTALVSKASRTGKRRARQPRFLQGPPRMPTFDFSIGL